MFGITKSGGCGAYQENPDWRLTHSIVRPLCLTKSAFPYGGLETYIFRQRTRVVGLRWNTLCQTCSGICVFESVKLPRRRKGIRNVGTHFPILGRNEPRRRGCRWQPLVCCGVHVAGEWPNILGTSGPQPVRIAACLPHDMPSVNKEAAPTGTCWAVL